MQHHFVKKWAYIFIVSIKNEVKTKNGVYPFLLIIFKLKLYYVKLCSFIMKTKLISFIYYKNYISCSILSNMLNII
jgi:hypothetical protein